MNSLNLIGVSEPSSEELYETPSTSKPPTYPIGRYDMYRLRFVSQKKNYTVYHSNKYKNEQIVFKTPIMKLPFGVEKYGNKDVLNAEFTNRQSNNIMFNFWTEMSQFEKFIENLSCDEETVINYLNANRFGGELVKQINGKPFTNCVRTRPEPYNPHFRLHVRHNVDMFRKTGDGSKQIMSSTDIKGKAAILTVQLGSLWVTASSYGLVWYVNSVQVV